MRSNPPTNENPIEVLADSTTQHLDPSLTSSVGDFFWVPTTSSATPEEEGRTVTIYLCGTCSNRNDYSNTQNYFDGENISYAYAIDQGEENIDKIIVDGPGCEENIDRLWVPYPSSATDGKQTPYPTGDGIKWGYGLDERILHILAVLKNEPQRELSKQDQLIHETLKEAKKITRVNIVGWSRGAAAGIKLANFMKRDSALKHIKINYFGIDPVMGPAQSKEDHRVLPNTVENLHGIYSLDEKSFGFSSIFADLLQTTFRHVIQLPGGHAQVAGSEKDHAQYDYNNSPDFPALKSADIPNLRGVGQVSRYFLEKFLLTHGAKLDPDKIMRLKLSDILELYKIIQRYRQQYREIAQRKSYLGINQVLGTEKKVILGNENWLHRTINEATTATNQFIPSNSTYIDLTHEMITKSVEKSKKYLDRLQMAFQQPQNLSVDLLTTTMRDVWSDLTNEIINENEIKMLAFAISEELQDKYRPSDLLDVSKRCYSYESLEIYAKSIIETNVKEHNELAQELNQNSNTNPEISPMNNTNQTPTPQTATPKKRKNQKIKNQNINHDLQQSNQNNELSLQTISDDLHQLKIELLNCYDTVLKMNALPLEKNKKSSKPKNVVLHIIKGATATNEKTFQDHLYESYDSLLQDINKIKASYNSYKEISHAEINKNVISAEDHIQRTKDNFLKTMPTSTWSLTETNTMLHHYKQLPLKFDELVEMIADLNTQHRQIAERIHPFNEQKAALDTSIKNCQQNKKTAENSYKIGVNRLLSDAEKKINDLIDPFLEEKIANNDQEINGEVEKQNKSISDAVETINDSIKSMINSNTPFDPQYNLALKNYTEKKSFTNMQVLHDNLMRIHPTMPSKKDALAKEIDNLIRTISGNIDALSRKDKTISFSATFDGKETIERDFKKIMEELNDALIAKNETTKKYIADISPDGDCIKSYDDAINTISNTMKALMNSPAIENITRLMNAEKLKLLDIKKTIDTHVNNLLAKCETFIPKINTPYMSPEPATTGDGINGTQNNGNEQLEEIRQTFDKKIKDAQSNIDEKVKNANVQIELFKQEIIDSLPDTLNLAYRTGVLLASYDAADSSISDLKKQVENEMETLTNTYNVYGKIQENFRKRLEKLLSVDIDNRVTSIQEQLKTFQLAEATKEEIEQHTANIGKAIFKIEIEQIQKRQKTPCDSTQPVRPNITIPEEQPSNIIIPIEQQQPLSQSPPPGKISDSHLFAALSELLIDEYVRLEKSKHTWKYKLFMSEQRTEEKITALKDETNKLQAIKRAEENLASTKDDVKVDFWTVIHTQLKQDKIIQSRNLFYSPSFFGSVKQSSTKKNIDQFILQNSAEITDINNQVTTINNNRKNSN